MTSRPLEIIGHRGARWLAPENTLPGFARTLAIGVSAFELDCAVTRDGIVVVSHDSLLNPDVTRGPDGQWLARAEQAIFHLTYEELQRYDVGRIQPGSDYARRFPEQHAVDRTRIPRLADLFALVAQARNDTVRFYLELKLSPLKPELTVEPAQFARAVVNAVREGGMTQRVAILSFDWRVLKAARKIAPELPLACLTAQQSWQDNVLAARTSSPWTAPLHVSQFAGSLPRTIRAAGGSVWASYYEEVDAALVVEAHELGLKVCVWTVNEPADMRRMIEWQVDGVISDRPDVLREVAGTMGVTLPRPTPVTL